MRASERNVRARRRLGVATVAVAAAALLAPAALTAKPATTVERAIEAPAPEGGFSALAYGRGDRYRVRDALIDGRLRPHRRERRRSLAYFGQISDLQLADEESPGRVEWFDGEATASFSNSGFRPNESMAPQSIDAAVRAMNGFYRSPVTDGRGRRARMLDVMLTGDLADSMQRNEVSWMRTLIEGGEIDPNSGTDARAGAGCAPGLPLENPAHYTGVQDYDDYATPNPLFYDPEDPRGAYAKWPTYPGLLDRAQEPFRAAGLRVPSYSVLGNHDVLFQGSIAAEPGFETIATGCLKYTEAIPPFGRARAGYEQRVRAALRPRAIAAARETEPGTVLLAPDDPDRAYVDRPQYKQLLARGKQKDGHGFAYVDPEENTASAEHAAYYAFSPRKGIRFIVLDTNAEAGVLIGPDTDGSSGNLDDPQFQWLQGQLERAQQRGQLAIAFAHHPIGSLSNGFADELSPCVGDDGHGHPPIASCDGDPRESTPIHTSDDVAGLLESYPNLIAFVAGHAHRDKVTLFEGGERGFWQIETPAIADWPVQSRLIQIFDNRDGTLSIFGTLIDTAAPPKVAKAGTDGKQLSNRQLAALHRSMAFNDPQNGNGDPFAAQGHPRDRNVELLIDDPRR